MAGRAKLIARLGALTLGGLATAGPLLAIIIAAALVVLAVLVVAIAWSDKMSSNVVRILAVILARDPGTGEAVTPILEVTPRRRGRLTRVFHLRRGRSRQRKPTGRGPTPLPGTARGISA